MAWSEWRPIRRRHDAMERFLATTVGTRVTLEMIAWNDLFNYVLKSKPFSSQIGKNGPLFDTDNM